jgi:hypothetical protein
VGGVPSSGSRHRVVRSVAGAPNGRADTPAGSGRPGRAVARVATTRLSPLQTRSVGLPAAEGSLSVAAPSTLIVSSGATTASRSPPASTTAVPPPAASSCQSGQLRTSYHPGCCSTRRSAPQNRSERLPAIPMVGSPGCSSAWWDRFVDSIVNPSLSTRSVAWCSTSTQCA